MKPWHPSIIPTSHAKPKGVFEYIWMIFQAKALKNANPVAGPGNGIVAVLSSAVGIAWLKVNSAMLCASNSKDASSTDQTQCNSGPDAPNLQRDGQENWCKGTNPRNSQARWSLIEMWWKQVETTWRHVLSSARAVRTCEIQKLMKAPKEIEWLSDPIMITLLVDVRL